MTNQLMYTLYYCSWRRPESMTPDSPIAYFHLWQGRLGTLIFSLRKPKRRQWKTSPPPKKKQLWQCIAWKKSYDYLHPKGTWHSKGATRYATIFFFFTQWFHIHIHKHTWLAGLSDIASILSNGWLTGSLILIA